MPGPGDVHPDRAHAELRLEPDLGRPRRPRRVRRAALRARRLGADARRPTTTSTRASAGAFEHFNAGTLNGTPIRYPISVHGPVIGTATVDGKPYALSRKRSTFGRDGLNLGRAQRHDRGQGARRRSASARPPTSSASPSTGPTSRATSHGVLHLGPAAGAGRAASTAACRRSAPATTSGRASCSRDEHPHDVERARRPAAQLEQPVGAGLHARRRRALRLGAARRAVRPVSRSRPRITDDVGIMNRAATEDVRSPVWPVVSQVLARRPGAERARPAGRRPARRLGAPRRAAPRRRRRRHSTTRPARRSWTRSGGRSPRR